MKCVFCDCAENERQFETLGYPASARGGGGSIVGSSEIFQRYWKYGLASGLYILPGYGLAERTRSRILRGRKRTYFVGFRSPGVFDGWQWQIQKLVISQSVKLNAESLFWRYETCSHPLVG